MESASASLVILASNGIRIFLKAIKKAIKHKHFFSANSTLNSIEKTISKALTDSDVSHGEFTLVNEKEGNYAGLKEKTRTKNRKRSDIKKNKFIKHEKRIETNRIIRQNQNPKVKTEV